MHGVVGGTKQATEQTTNGRRGPRGEEQEDRGWIRITKRGASVYFSSGKQFNLFNKQKNTLTMWACSFCTFLNTNATTQCEMCQSANPNATYVNCPICNQPQLIKNADNRK